MSSPDPAPWRSGMDTDMDLNALGAGLKAHGPLLSLLGVGGMLIYQFAVFQNDISHRFDAYDRRMDRFEAVLVDRFTPEDAEARLSPIEVRLDRVESDLDRLNGDFRDLARSIRRPGGSHE